MKSSPSLGRLSFILIAAFSLKAFAIVDGIDAQKLNNFAKSVVFIVLQNEAGVPETCTGSFISTHHILTAAHCVTSDSNDTSLILGVKPIENESAMTLTIEKIDIHPNYSKDTLDRNDLAIIKIKETYPDKRYIFSLPFEKEKLKAFNQFDPTLTAIGYGQTSGLEESEDQDNDVGTLRYVKLSDKLTDDKNLILNQSTGGGVCFGDSGGALTLRLQKRKYIVGVSSGVFDDSKTAVGSTGPIDYCKQQSLFMNVFYYLPWISEIISK